MKELVLVFVLVTICYTLGIISGFQLKIAIDKHEAKIERKGT